MRVSRKAEVTAGNADSKGSGTDAVKGGAAPPLIKEAAPGEPRPFVEKLLGSLLTEVRGTIETLQKRVDETAAQLIQQPNQLTVDAYKESVSHLLGFIIGNTYKILHLQGYKKNPDGKPKSLVKVDIVNQKLADLGRDVMNSQQPVLDIAKRLDEIRGLILDLYDWKPGP